LLDELAARATVSPVDRFFDGWHAKAAPELPFRRCNSVLPVGGLVVDHTTPDLIGRLEDWYGELGQRVIVVISSAEPGADQLDRFLEARGYDHEAPVHVMTATIPSAAPSAVTARRGELSTGPQAEAAHLPEVTVTDGIDEAWARRYAVAHGGDRVARARTEAYGRMLVALGSAALGASATIGGEAAGVGFGVVDSGWVGIFGMGTARDHRRRGVASAIVGAILDRAARAGAEAAYLQVETDNHAAIELYRGLGFTVSHGYHYRVSAPQP